MDNYAQPGTPVQFFESLGENEFRTHPAIISSVKLAMVNIRVFPDDERISFLAENIRHKDFKSPGFPYWDYIPKRHP